MGDMYADPVLPDCARCGSPVALEVDHDSAREVCVGCGLAQPPTPVLEGVRDAVRRARAAARPLIAPDCKRRAHDRCRAYGCECWCHHPDETPGHLAPSEVDG